MKKIFLALVSLFTFSTQILASGDKPVEVTQLPAKTQEFVKQHFGNIEISYAKQDNDFFDRSYTVVLTNGDKLEFYRNGEWKEVDCEHNQVPTSVIPEAINNYITTKHKGQVVKEIKKERRHYEVKLGNGLDMEFNLDGKLLRYD